MLIILLIITDIYFILISDEVQRQLILSKPKILIGIPETVPVLQEALTLTKLNLPIIVVNNIESTKLSGIISFNELSFDNTVDTSVLKEVKRSIDDIAFLPYSSGTTGLPKGVELTNKNIVVNCIQQDVETVKHYNDTSGKFH